MKQQVLVIHGGDTFGTREAYLKFLKEDELNFEKLLRPGWKENLRNDLDADYEVALAQMPNKTNAVYEEWEITFNKIISFLQDGVILVGHSMGGCFIAKYLAENNLPIKIKATFLIAAPFGNNEPEYSLYSFEPPAELGAFNEQAGKIFIYQSSDDPLVPATDAEKWQAALPNAELKMFSDRGHFSQEHLPELVEAIKSSL